MHLSLAVDLLDSSLPSSQVEFEAGMEKSSLEEGRKRKIMKTNIKIEKAKRK